MIETPLSGIRVNSFANGVLTLGTPIIDQYAPGVPSSALVNFVYQQLVHAQP